MTMSAPQRDHLSRRSHVGRLLFLPLLALSGLVLPLVAAAQVPAETEMRRLYNQACSAAQLGDRTTAENLLQQVIETSLQPQLVADAHYNLGWLDLQQLRNQLRAQPTPIPTSQPTLSSQPSAAGPIPQRSPASQDLQASPWSQSTPIPKPSGSHTGSGPTSESETDRLAELEQLVDAAEQHFRAALQIQPDHVQARQNLEIARLWMTRHKQLADQAARQSQYESQQGAAFLLWMIDKQTTLLSQTLQLDTQPDSFSRRRQLRELQLQQRQLRDDGTLLEAKLVEALSAMVNRPDTGDPPQPKQVAPATAAGQKQPVSPTSATSFSKPEPLASRGANAGGSTSPSGQVDLPEAVAQELARARQALEAAAQSPGYELAPLIPRQTDVLASVQRLFAQVATFDALLARALAVQTTLVDQVAAWGPSGSAPSIASNEANLNATPAVVDATAASRSSPGGEVGSNTTRAAAGELRSLPSSDRVTPGTASGEATAADASTRSAAQRNRATSQVDAKFGQMRLLSLQQAHIGELAAALRMRATTELHAAQPANLAEQLDQALEGPPAAQPPTAPAPKATPPREPSPDATTPGTSPTKDDATKDDPAAKKTPAGNPPDEDQSPQDSPTSDPTVKPGQNVGQPEPPITTLPAVPTLPTGTDAFPRLMFVSSPRPISSTSTVSSIPIVRQTNFVSQPVAWSEDAATRGRSTPLSGPGAAGREPSEPARFPLGLDWGRDALRSRRKAIELTPQIETLAQQASSRLSAQQPREARPLQHEALQLLQQIAAESTPDGGTPSNSNEPSNSAGKTRDSSANRSQPDSSSDENSSTNSSNADANASDNKTDNSPSKEEPSDAERPDANQAERSAGDSSTKREPSSTPDTKQPASTPNEPESNPSDHPSSRQPGLDRSDAKTSPPQKQEAENRDLPQEDRVPSESSSQPELPPEPKQPKKASSRKASSATPQPAHSSSKEAASGEPSTLADRADSMLSEQELAAIEQAQRQVEILFDKVRQREREHRERQEQLQRILRSRVRVEKDW